MTPRARSQRGRAETISGPSPLQVKSSRWSAGGNMSQSTLSRVGRDAIEHASRDELQNLQLERLKWTLRHAYDNVPHYRQAFDEKGVHPDDLKQLSDLSLFPFTAKQDLRNNYPYGIDRKSTRLNSSHVAISYAGF